MGISISILAKVALVKGERSCETVEKVIKLAGGLREFVGKPILIKVNFIATKSWNTGATTDPIVIEGLIKCLKTVNDRVAVVESDATMTNADKAYRMTGMNVVCEKYGVPFVNLRHVREKVKVRVAEPETLSELTLPKMVMDSYVISVAKLKTHADTQVTLGLKNMFGLLPDKFKAKYHLKNIEKVVVDINSVVKPSFTIIDGFVGMEGKGPVDGDPVKMDVVIAGRDPVATDSVAAQVMGFDPTHIFHIWRAGEKGLGTLSDIEVLGDGIKNVRRVFKR